MGVKLAVQDIGKDLGQMGTALAGLFDKDVREARAAVAKASAEAAKKALEDKKVATIDAIKAGAGKTTAAVAGKVGLAEHTANGLLALPKAGFRFGMSILEVPVTFAMKPVKLATQGLSKVFTKSPGVALAGTVVIGAVGVAKMVGRHNSRKMQEKHAAPGEMLAAQAAAPVSYMNSASQADVDARVAADRAAGTSPDGQAAALAARQSAASASPAV